MILHYLNRMYNYPSIFYHISCYVAKKWLYDIIIRRAPNMITGRRAILYVRFWRDDLLPMLQV